MKRTISILLASLAITAGPSMAGASTSFDPNSTPASDSVPDPWTMFVEEVARDRGLTYDRAADEIGAWLRCMDGSCKPGAERWRRLALEAGWPESELGRLSCVMWGESRGDEKVVYRGTRRRPEHSIGLLQLNVRGQLWRWFEAQGLDDPDDLLDPETNLRVGLAMWSERGWRPWGAARLCRHL
jgi:hypothetical protein